eukprot:1137937-Pelagomonas_calceolata.AAC.3
MGIWRLVRHAPERPDSPPPILHRRVPSKLPPRSFLNMKSMSGFNNGCQFLDSMAQIDKGFDHVLIVNGASHTNQDDVQSRLVNKVNIPVLKRDLGRVKVSLSTWDRAHKDSVRAALVPVRGADTIREKPVWDSL